MITPIYLSSLPILVIRHFSEEADAAKQRATEAEQRATKAEQRAAKLAKRLQELRIDPDELG